MDTNERPDQPQAARSRWSNHYTPGCTRPCDVTIGDILRLGVIVNCHHNCCILTETSRAFQRKHPRVQRDVLCGLWGHLRRQKRLRPSVGIQRVQPLPGGAVLQRQPGGYSWAALHRLPPPRLTANTRVRNTEASPTLNHTPPSIRYVSWIQCVHRMNRGCVYDIHGHIY